MRPVREVACSGGETAPRAQGLPAGTDRLFRRLIVLIAIGILGNIIFSFATAGGAAFRSITHFSPVYFILAMLLGVVPWFTGSLRMMIWTRFLGNNLRYRDVFKISIGAELGAAVSPPIIGGNAVKVGMLMQKGLSGSTALSLAALESLEDSIFFIVMVPVALTISSSWDLPMIKSCIQAFRDRSFWVLTGSIAAALVLVIALARRCLPRLTQRIPLLRTVTERIRLSCNDFAATYRTIIRGGKKIFVLTMVLTSVQWICRYSIVTLLFLSLDLPARPVLFMALQVVVFALMIFVPTPGAAGGAEAMFSLLYCAFLPAGSVGLVTAGWRFLTFYFLLFLAAALFLLSGMQARTAAKQAGEHGAPS